MSRGLLERVKRLEGEMEYALGGRPGPPFQRAIFVGPDEPGTAEEIFEKRGLERWFWPSTVLVRYEVPQEGAT